MLGDVIRQFVQRVPHGEFGSDTGDGETRGLGRQGRGAGHARIHLDHQHLTVLRVHGELDVASSGRDTHLADDRDSRIPHLLVFPVGERHGRRDRYRIPGMNSHRIQVLDGTDDDDVVLAVAHHLQFELFPAQHRALDEHRTRGRKVEGAIDEGGEFFPVVCDAPAGAAEGE